MPSTSPIDTKSKITLEGVNKRYQTTIALNDLTMAVADNKITALLGPNGAGKSTIFNILTTLQKHDSGEVYIDGLDIRKTAHQIRNKISVVFQDSSLDDKLTIAENLDLHGGIYGIRSKLRRKRITAALELVDLKADKDKIVKTLSTGMKRRVEIARAMIHDSEILLMDEPTVGLDLKTQDKIWSYVMTLKELHKKTILVSTHNISEVKYADYIYIMTKGKVIASGSSEKLIRDFGQQSIVCVPKDKKLRQQILENLHDRLIVDSEREVVIKSDEKFVKYFFENYMDFCISIEVKQPSLESVYLDLTRMSDVHDKIEHFGISRK